MDRWPKDHSPKGRPRAPDGKLLAATDGVDIAIVEFPAGRERLRLHTRSREGVMTSVAFAPDGRTLASGSRDNAMRLWDLTDGRPLAVLSSLAEDAEAYALIPDPPAIDFLGEDPTAARNLVFCRVGACSYPLDLCAERVVVPGLLARVMARDATWNDP